MKLYDKNIIFSAIIVFFFSFSFSSYTLANSNFGTDNQVPFMNAGGTDFDYSSNFLFDGSVLLLGRSSPVSTEKFLVYGTSTPSTRVECTASACSAQSAYITPTSGGFFGSFDNNHAITAWRDKAMFGAYSTASGIMISAYNNTSQKIEFQIGGNTTSNIYGTMTGLGKFGWGTNNPAKAIEINSTNGENLRLTYNDSNGSATVYTDFDLSSTGDLTIFPTGGDVNINGNLYADNITFGNEFGIWESYSEPADPIDGSVIWQTDGTGAGDQGDIMIKINSGGITKTITLVDFSEGALGTSVGFPLITDYEVFEWGTIFFIAFIVFMLLLIVTIFLVKKLL